MRTRTTKPKVRIESLYAIGGLIFILIVLVVMVPGFGAALWQTLYCAFANVQCVQVLP